MNFSSDPDLIDLINSESFIRKVRRTSVTLSNAGLISNEDIKEIALGESFPRVALILSTTRSKKGSELNPVFGGLSPKADYESQYREIRRVILSSVYSEGIQRIVASLTAALCIKQIPLNSDIQLFDLGKELENQALSDLDRIIGLIEVTGAQASFNNSAEPSASDANIYFASSIDPFYISEEVFSKIKGKAAVLEDVQLSSYINVPFGYKAFCWIYITGTSIEGDVETGFFIQEGALVEEVIESIAMHTNEACIEKNSTLICSPNRGSLKRETLTYKKSELYPSANLDLNKEITFTLSTRLHYITFSSRTLSTEVNRELISIRLFLLPEELAPDSDTAIANRYNPTLQDMEGVVYGTKNSYYCLDNKGPHSLLIDVERGAASTDISNKVDQIDTLYFRIKPNCLTSDVGGNLSIRIASPPNEDYTEWTLPIPLGSSAESITLSLLSSIYERHLESKILGAMPHPNAIQVIPFTKTDTEVRMVLDIIELPDCIEVATGTAIKPLTQYKGEPRSITVKTVATLPLEGNSSFNTSPHAAKVSNLIKKGSRIQAVYDKIDFLDSVQKKRYRKDV